MPNTISLDDIETRLDELAHRIQRIAWRLETQRLAIEASWPASADEIAPFDGSTWS